MDSYNWLGEQLAFYKNEAGKPKIEMEEDQLNSLNSTESSFKIQICYL